MMGTLGELREEFQIDRNGNSNISQKLTTQLLAMSYCIGLE